MNIVRLTTTAAMAHPFFEVLPTDGAFVVVHPPCQRPILLLDLWVVRQAQQSVIRLEGICRYCDRYVRLEYRPSMGNPSMDNGRAS